MGGTIHRSTTQPWKVKKRREEIDIRNNADQMVYQTEKTLGELGDKVDESEKADVQAEIDKLKETVKSGDTDAIKAGTEELQKKFYALSEKLYAQSGAAQGNPGDAGFNPGQNADGTYDADFTDKTGE